MTQSSFETEVFSREPRDDVIILVIYWSEAYLIILKAERPFLLTGSFIILKANHSKVTLFCT